MARTGDLLPDDFGLSGEICSGISRQDEERSLDPANVTRSFLLIAF